MADRPSTSTSRVGRPRTRSAHQTPHVLLSKVGRPRSKLVYKPKVKDSAKKAPAKQKLVRHISPVDQDVVVVIDPEDQEDKEFPLPTDRLPDTPPLDLEQHNNIPINPPNQPLDIPVGKENQQKQAEEPNQVPNQPIDLPVEEPKQPNQLNQPPNLPINASDPMANQQQLNWSYFKPEFSGKPEEDTEAHLLKTNDWIDTHNFPDDAKVRRFCLTLTGEARLWYETLGAAQLDWEALQECF